MADSDNEQEIRDALASRDPVKLARAAGSEIGALKAAEDVIEAREKAETRPSRIMMASQALVGWLALIGVALNVVQMYANHKQYEESRAADQQRWQMEFQRSQEADKHAAFLQVSTMITDSIVDRRLLGYALIGEFMGDKEYYDKAQLMLAERLGAEASDKDFDEAHRNAVRVIVRTLSQTKDCVALIQGASSIHKLRAARDAQTGAKANSKLNEDDGISTPVEDLYADFVRYIYGRAMIVCAGRYDELRLVRNEIRSAMMPLMKGETPKEKAIAANRIIAQYLRDRCLDEPQGALSECPAIFEAYAKRCEFLETKKPDEWPNEKDGCALIRAAKSAVLEHAHATAASAAHDQDIPVDTAVH